MRELVALNSVIAKLKLPVLPLAQITRGFDNPCYSERLHELLILSTKLVDNWSWFSEI